MNLIQHSEINPTTQILSKIIHYPSSSIYYYDNQNNLISDNSNANSVMLTKIGVFYKNINHGYSLNLESYAYPYNFKFGRPMDYHE